MHVSSEQLNKEDFSSTPVRYSLETERGKYLTQDMREECMTLIQ
jgi:hypothetical protein